MSEQLATPSLEQQLSLLAREVDELLAGVEPVTDGLNNINTFAPVTDAYNNALLVAKSLKKANSLLEYQLAFTAPADTAGYIGNWEFKWGIDTPKVLFTEVHESRLLSSSTHPDDQRELRELDLEDVAGLMRVILDGFAAYRSI